jgi:muconolactone D-isomerase
MSEFLVRQRSVWPVDPATDRLRAELGARERARAAELREAGILLRLWRIPGTRDALGLYAAPDVTVLHDALASLPMFPWLHITVEPLASHPQEIGPQERTHEDP